jgi:protein gp37
MTKIQWTNRTWNPVTGCTKTSPGCENCYAEGMVRRLQKLPQSKEKYRNGFDVTFHPDELVKPLHWKKPQRIFVCSMGDLFHEDVSFYFVTEVLKTICKTLQHIYQILTKRPERMAMYFSVMRHIPSNIWLGVTVCNQQEADEKIPVLLDIPAKVRFVSIEPMLESVDLKYYLPQVWSMRGEILGAYLHWVIVGGETGVNARPMNPDWARALRDQCKETGIPFFFKQMSKKQPIPDDLMVRKFPKGGGE